MKLQHLNIVVVRRPFPDSVQALTHIDYKLEEKHGSIKYNTGYLLSTLREAASRDSASDVGIHSSFEVNHN
jgi:hypothetical protein